MTSFRHIAVQSDAGPHTTLVAGVDMADRSWATTSSSAAKVRMLRARPHAAVLSDGDGGGGGRLVVGRATVLDVRRPLDGLADPVAASLAGLVVARLGLGNLDQLVGYVQDGRAVPASWRPSERVLIVVRETDVLQWDVAGVVSSTGSFARRATLPKPSRRPRRDRRRSMSSGLTLSQQALVGTPGGCVIGLETTRGPVALPGWWDQAGETVAVREDLLGSVHADLPGRCSVTIDESDASRPSAKVGVMLRGDVTLLGPRAVNDRGTLGSRAALLAVHPRRITAWDGFETQTLDVS